MPVTATELIDSREITVTTSGPVVKLKYIISETDSDATAYSELKSAAPQSYTVDGIVTPRAALKVKPIHIEAGTTGHWEGTAEYSFPSANSGGGGGPETGTSVYNFDTTGGTATYKHALDHIADYAASGTPPNHGGAINVTKEGVEGVDVITPNFGFTVTQYLADNLVNTATIATLTGCVNNGGFYGFNAGEVLFLGATGTKRNDGTDWEINFRFACSPNFSNQVIQSPLGNITVPTKLGWDYLWVEYIDHFDGTKTVRAARAAHVERVYPYANLGALPV